MLIELSLFLLELIFGLVYPVLMTLKSVENAESKSNASQQSWTFYWLSFILLNSLSWSFDFFLWNLVKTFALIALTIPQLSLSYKASEYVLGPLQDLVLGQVSQLSDLAKSKLV